MLSEVSSFVFYQHFAMRHTHSPQLAGLPRVDEAEGLRLPKLQHAAGAERRQRCHLFFVHENNRIATGFDSEEGQREGAKLITRRREKCVKYRRIRLKIART
jgi:hypothetical protein